MRKIFLALWVVFPLVALAVPSTQEMDKKAVAIANALRCPVCRGIPISESPSDLAKEMMQVIRQKLSEGSSEQEILDYFVDRYGEWILLEPKAKGINWILWLLPVVLLAGGAVGIGFLISRWTRKN